MTDNRAAPPAEPAPTVPDQPRPRAEPAERIASLDFIRGLAVMGILAANIVAFGQPMSAMMYPGAFATPHGEAEGWMWVAQFVLVDGKMRGLFSLLFGAGLYLFMERAWARGATRWLQVRRLLWLGVFGLLHYFLIWRGDILFLYACSGLVALLFVRLSRRQQFVIGVLGYVGGGIFYLMMTVPMQLVADTSFGEQPAMAEFAASIAQSKSEDLADGAAETKLITGGDYPALVAHNVTEHAADLLMMLFSSFETLPLMLLGMALYRIGLFDGGIEARRQRLWGWVGLALGAVLTLAVALWARGTGFSYFATLAAFSGWSHFPRLPMILGLAALLALYAPHAHGWLGRRLSAAGRAAFTNYLGTSIVMMVVFHGWGAGLFAELTRGQLYIVMLGTWLLMLAWSLPWLKRFRYGPLEWLWRCLTYGRLLALTR